MLKIAVIGDIHTGFDLKDTELLNSSEYHLILFTGDLPGRSHRQTVRIAKIMSHLKKPAVMIAGNHDATSVKHLLGEITGDRFLKQSDSSSQFARVEELRKALGPVRLSAYECIDLKNFTGVDTEYKLITGRPHSMGGPGIAFLPYMSDAYGVESEKDSAGKTAEAAVPGSRLLILAHNGPAGLGSNRDDLFGADFKAEAGDHGDRDLTEAISQMKQKGCHISAVIAGHMHHALRGGGKRKWLKKEDHTTYINAARVPRIIKKSASTARHHVRICIANQGEAEVEQVFWDESGRII